MAACSVPLRLARTTLAEYDPALSQVELVADESQNDLFQPRGPLLKMIISTKITKLRVFSDSATASGITLFVVHGKGVGSIVRIAPKDDIERASMELQRIRTSLTSEHNSEKVEAARKEPLFIDEIGIMMLRAVMVGTELAPSFADVVASSLREPSPGRSLVPLPQQIWRRGSPLYELAVESATRTKAYGFVGPDGFAQAMLTAMVDRMGDLLPSGQVETIEQMAAPAAAPDAAAEGEEAPADSGASKSVAEHEETLAKWFPEVWAAMQEAAKEAAESSQQRIDDEPEDGEPPEEAPAPAPEEAPMVDLAAEARSELEARLSPALQALLSDFRSLTTSDGFDWRAPLRTYEHSLFARTKPKELDLSDAGVAPLLTCLQKLRDAAASDWRSTCPQLPAWAGSWRPLCVRAHGNLHGGNVLVDGERRLHYVGFGKRRSLSVVPLFYDAARLVSHLLVAAVNLEPATGNGVDGGSSQGGAEGGSNGQQAATKPGAAKPAGAKQLGSRGAGGAEAAASERLRLLCACVDVLLPVPPGGSCMHDSLLLVSSLPTSDLVPEGTPDDIRAAILIAQQLIEGACKTVLAASASARVRGSHTNPGSTIDAHDVHPIGLLLPMLVHCLELCGARALQKAQQRAAWYIACRAATIITAFLGGASTAETSAAGASAAIDVSSPGGDAAAELAAARRELEETRAEAATALQFQKALAERYEKELETLRAGAISDRAAKTPKPAIKQETASSTTKPEAAAAPPSSSATPKPAGTPGTGGPKKAGAKSARPKGSKSARPAASPATKEVSFA